MKKILFLIMILIASCTIKAQVVRTVELSEGDVLL